MEHIRKYLIAIVLFLFLMAPVQILNQLTDFVSNIILAVYIGIMILLATLIKDKTIRYFSQLMTFIVMIYMMLIPVFQQGLQPLQSIQFLLSHQAGQLVVIVSAIAIGMINLAVDYEHWKISFVIIFIFMLLSQLIKQTVIFQEFIGFLLISLALAFLLEQGNLFKNKERVKLTGLTLILLAISFVGAFTLPRLVQPNSLLEEASAYVQQKLDQTNFYQVFKNGKPKNKTGYGENDDELGGPLEKDYSPVFQATFNQGLPAKDFYWRIEVKDYYTGRGWKTSIDQTREVKIGNWSNETTNSLSDRPNYITIQPQSPTEFFVSPYGENHFYASNNEAKTTIVEQVNAEKIIPNDEWNSQSYTLINRNPSYTNEQLKSANFANLDKGIQQGYTQLPDAVPERVYQLAKNITAGQQTTYDKAVAIEQYLKNSGVYLYSQQEAKRTPVNQDYVDYFLFDHKVGYCDNFATSMVVLNRTLGIPTRWAKGFTLGRMTSSDQERPSYQVSNDDAHSWVEVYFPNIGWVPFDPTTGFGTGQANIQEEKQQSMEGQNILENSADERPKNERLQENQSISSFEKNKFTLFMIGMIAVISMLYYCFRLKLKIIKLNRYVTKKAARFEKGFLQLLTICEAYQKKEVGETVRDYGQRLIEIEPQLNESLLRLLNRYEETEFAQQGNQQIQTNDQSAFKKILELLQESKALKKK